MTLKEYDALKEGEKIKILHPLEKGRITKTWVKFTDSKGNKGVMIGSIFYTYNFIESVKG